MFKLNNNDFNKVIQLVKSQNELSVLSVIKGAMPGEIYVNSIDNPTAALIRTCECNLIAGNSNDANFNSEVSMVLDFWDPLTPDSSEWIDLIPTIHKNPFIRKYKRRHYILSVDDFKECKETLKDGFILEKVDIDLLRQRNYENSEKLLEWTADWGDDAKFQKYGAGYFIHNGKVIVSWSLSDCSFDKKITIGIHTDERYRKNGFGKTVVSAVVKDCFTKGYEKINWLCVDTNKGSIALAEKLGFKYNNNYYAFSTYPPIENIKDLSESEWFEWGEYLENASKTQDCLISSSMYCYIKSNDIEKTISIMTSMEQRKITLDYSSIKDYIIYLQNYGLGSNFRSQVWLDFLNKNIPC
ncbi:GNAT family N-acetyltransferase [Anaerocolumna xylanovorans]|uniref:GNAT acetyltransferase n=1 Tax=Anaerocolumna xylanovorans DSM 12503 TaxID=1121345 RepID=A0A1M7YG13_9FIRM|nr:GNAT family N-acetyltransferase [Anaerocolumna xylanovorans]SHO51553.1 GNAT acetyltransferase [Anaerocolumna xylanovorans DSM 12503]